MGSCNTKTDSKYQTLYTSTFDDLKLLSFEGIITKCKVVDVYDGYLKII